MSLLRNLEYLSLPFPTQDILGLPFTLGAFVPPSLAGGVRGALARGDGGTACGLAGCCCCCGKESVGGGGGGAVVVVVVAVATAGARDTGGGGGGGVVTCCEMEDGTGDAVV